MYALLTQLGVIPYTPAELTSGGARHPVTTTMYVACCCWRAGHGS
jgi:hypothetical protein